MHALMALQIALMTGGVLTQGTIKLLDAIVDTHVSLQQRFATKRPIAQVTFIAILVALSHMGAELGLAVEGVTATFHSLLSAMHRLNVPLEVGASTRGVAAIETLIGAFEFSTRRYPDSSTWISDGEVMMRHTHEGFEPG